MTTMDKPAARGFFYALALLIVSMYNRFMSTTNATPGGLTMTMTCSRDGVQRWAKQVYIPNTQREEAYAARLSKRYGEFFYTLCGEIKVVSRKPVNVPLWNE